MGLAIVPVLGGDLRALFSQLLLIIPLIFHLASGQIRWCSVTEMQTFLFELITHFTFDTIDPRGTWEERCKETLPTMVGWMAKGNEPLLKVSLAEDH